MGPKPAAKRKAPPRKSPGERAQRALRGTCTVRLSRDRADLGGIAASLLDDLMGEGDRIVAEFLITPERQRVTYGAGEGTFTVVYRGGDGFSFWDHRTRSMADIAGSAMPRTRVAPSGPIEVVRRTRGRTTTVELSITDASLGAVRHVITLSNDPELAPYGPALLGVLHCGPVCHAESGLPWAEIAGAGVITRERAFVDGEAEPSSEISVKGLEVVSVTARDFAPPAGYRRLDTIVGKPAEAPPSPAPDAPSPSEQQAAAVRQALEGGIGVNRQALSIRQDLTPDCLGSTRFGSMTASLHQDFLTAASNTINLIAPLIGPTTIAGGTWTIPWLGNLNALGATAPGSGIRCFLREPRTVTSPPGPAGGGRGLLDRLAFGSLSERDASGLTRTQREFAAGTLATTLAAWGITAPTDANVMAASGDLTMVSIEDQRTVVEGYEMMEAGVIRITGLPASLPAPPAPFFSFGSLTMGSFTTPPLFIIGVTGIAGTVNFASLGGGPMVTALTIGSSGNIVVGLAFPTCTLTGTLIRAVTPFGGFVLTVGTVAACILMPIICPLIATMVALMSFVLTNITVITATATAVTWTVDVRFDYDPSTERVEPFVSLVARTGTVTVGTFGPVPNLIANAVDALIAGLMNMFDLWGFALAGLGTGAIQSLLREQGFQLPVAGRQTGLRAIGGSAQSSPGGLLLLEADIQPVGGIASEPFTTQVNTRQMMATQHQVAHLDMRRALNPQPTTPPPGPGPVMAVGTFAGIGLSQNALNYYVFHQWLTRRFEVATTDPALIARFVAVAPGLFVRQPVRIHMWPAVAPRVEITPHEIARGTRPLVLFFDDVRVCFEVPNPQGADGMTGFMGSWELSCNFRTTATIDLAWPWVFTLRADPVWTSAVPLEPRSWEFVDPNVPAIMTTVTPAALGKMVELVSAIMLAPLTGTTLGAPLAPRPWPRPLPAMQQELFPTIAPGPPLRPQQVYMELLARRKALYALTAIDTALLELVDGSGSPMLNALLPTAAGPLPTTVGTMRCTQGAALRDLLLPLTGPPAGP